MNAFLDIIADTWDYLKARRKHWVVPLVVTIVVLSMILILSNLALFAPFAYTTF